MSLIDRIKKLFGKEERPDNPHNEARHLEGQKLENFIETLILWCNKSGIVNRKDWWDYERSFHWLLIKNKNFNKEYYFQFPTYITTDTGLTKKEKKLKTEFLSIYGDDGRLLYRDEKKNVKFISAKGIYCNFYGGERRVH